MHLPTNRNKKWFIQMILIDDYYWFHIKRLKLVNPKTLFFSNLLLKHVSRNVKNEVFNLVYLNFCCTTVCQLKKYHNSLILQVAIITTFFASACNIQTPQVVSTWFVGCYLFISFHVLLFLYKKNDWVFFLFEAKVSLDIEIVKLSSKDLWTCWNP